MIQDTIHVSYLGSFRIRRYGIVCGLDMSGLGGYGRLGATRAYSQWMEMPNYIGV